MRHISGWVVAGIGALALAPVAAQVAGLKLPTVAASSPGAKPSASPEPEAAKSVSAAMVDAAASAASAASVAQYGPSSFETYKSYLVQRARAAGVREGTVLAHVPDLRLNQRAIELDRAQMPTSSRSDDSGFPPLAPYIQEHVTPSLIARGQARYTTHWPYLVRIYNRFGVDPAVLMAIYGKETSYGAITGSFDLLESLASLAYEGRRRPLFESEFLAALKLVDAGVSRSRLQGSYAGATGYPQFMPSVVLRLRADGDGDGIADIWNNEVDALASIANYLRDAGWKAGVPWGAAAQVPATLNRAAMQSELRPTRCPRVFQRHSRWMTVGEWRALGVAPIGKTLPDNEMAFLMEPDGPGRTAYLLTNNYRAVLDYNCSNYYAMSVVLLSDRIARR